MFHCKVVVVDGLWSSVGSTNFDNRSFRLNDEANLNVLSRFVRGAADGDFQPGFDAVAADQLRGIAESTVDGEAFGAR